MTSDVWDLNLKWNSKASSWNMTIFLISLNSATKKTKKLTSHQYIFVEISLPLFHCNLPKSHVHFLPIFVLYFLLPILKSMHIFPSMHVTLYLYPQDALIYTCIFHLLKYRGAFFSTASYPFPFLKVHKV